GDLIGGGVVGREVLAGHPEGLELAEGEPHGRGVVVGEDDVGEHLLAVMRASHDHELGLDHVGTRGRLGCLGLLHPHGVLAIGDRSEARIGLLLLQNLIPVHVHDALASLSGSVLGSSAMVPKIMSIMSERSGSLMMGGHAPPTRSPASNSLVGRVRRRRTSRRSPLSSSTSWST